MALLLALGAVLAGRGAAEEVQTLAGFRVPEYDENGRLTSELFGDLAQFLPNGLVKITNLRIDFYKDKDVEMRVTAPDCNYDEKRKQAQSDSSVRIARENMVVTGVGFLWKAGQERLEIYNEAKVVLKEARRRMEAKEPPPAEAGKESPDARTGEEP